jgi:hypothetical protein
MIETFEGGGVVVEVGSTSGTVSKTLVAKGVFVNCKTVGRGVIGMVGDNVRGKVGVIDRCASSELSMHPVRKITNKVNMTILDEFNGI